MLHFADHAISLLNAFFEQLTFLFIFVEFLWRQNRQEQMQTYTVVK